jgi:lipopolysaccharide transport system ATP-binding protein
VPDILIVDEALAVGDMPFQAKCMGRIRSMMESGTTVLFVSHDIGVVKALCQRCLYLEGGRMAGYGATPDVAGLYIARSHMEINAAINHEVSKNAISHNIVPSHVRHRAVLTDIIVQIDDTVNFGSAAKRYGAGGARILDVKLLDSFGRPKDQIEVGQQFIIQVSVRFEKDFSTFAMGYSIRDLKGQMLVGTLTTCENIQMPAVGVGDVYVLDFVSTNKLRAGIYTISVGLELPVIVNEQHVFLDVVENVCVFQSNFPADRATWFPSMVSVPAEIKFIKVPSH